MKKKIILMLSMVAFVVCFLALSVSAEEIDGIDYTLNKNGTAEVNTGNKDCALTTVVIPSTVEYNDNVYTVVKIDSQAFKGNGTVVSITTPSTL